MDCPIVRHPKFCYKTESQSHEPEFGYLKSLKIDKKINKIRCFQTVNSSLFLLSTNDKLERVRSGDASAIEYFELAVVMLRQMVYPAATKYLLQAIEKWDRDDQDLAQEGILLLGGLLWFMPILMTLGGLSPFATMWNALFTWVIASSLTYIYEKAESFQGEYMFVNGREYLQKIVLPNGRSSEVKQTLAGCLARALSSVIGDLKLPIPTSTMEQGLGCYRCGQCRHSCWSHHRRRGKQKRTQGRKERRARGVEERERCIFGYLEVFF